MSTFFFAIRKFIMSDQLMMSNGDYSNIRQNSRISLTNFLTYKLVYKEKLANKETALVREIQIKGWSIAKKKALIDGNIDLLKQLSEKH